MPADNLSTNAGQQQEQPAAQGAGYLAGGAGQQTVAASSNRPGVQAQPAVRVGVPPGVARHAAAAEGALKRGPRLRWLCHCRGHHAACRARLQRRTAGCGAGEASAPGRPRCWGERQVIGGGGRRIALRAALQMLRRLCRAGLAGSARCWMADAAGQGARNRSFGEGAHPGAGTHRSPRQQAGLQACCREPLSRAGRSCAGRSTRACRPLAACGAPGPADHRPVSLCSRPQRHSAGHAQLCRAGGAAQGRPACKCPEVWQGGDLTCTWSGAEGTVDRLLSWELCREVREPAVPTERPRGVQLSCRESSSSGASWNKCSRSAAARAGHQL